MEVDALPRVTVLASSKGYGQGFKHRENQMFGRGARVQVSVVLQTQIKGNPLRYLQFSALSYLSTKYHLIQGLSLILDCGKVK